MKGLAKNETKFIILNRIVLLICILTTTLVWMGCHRKVGLKPGEQPKNDKSKCKCKKPKSRIYSETLHQKSTFYYFQKSNGFEVKV